MMISDAERAALTVGLKQVRKALAEHRAKKVFVAMDCDAFLLEGLEGLCRECGIVPEYAQTMAQLGQECGIDVKASCACIC
jgi:large subunit ribosomal protein L7A